jgi:hypothetical protein
MELISSQSQNSTFSSLPLQKLAYKQLTQARFTNTLHDTVQRRIQDLFSPWDIDFLNLVLLSPCFARLKEIRVSDAVKVFKCWTNAWATSYRYQEGIKLPCLFGCDNCKDEQKHYMMCPNLYALMKYHFGQLVSDDPLQRWGLVHPSVDTLKFVACVFSGYHALRKHLKQTCQFFEINQTHIPHHQVRKHWALFAEAVFVEARELSCVCRKFLASEFLDFIINGADPFVGPDSIMHPAAPDPFD